VVVGDNDQAGAGWARAFRQLSERIVTACVPEGKDVTDYWTRGGKLRKWVEEILEPLDV
jgi:hypothetical protein